MLARSKVVAVFPAFTCPLLSHLLAKHNHVSLSLSLSWPIPSFHPIPLCTWKNIVAFLNSTFGLKNNI